MTAPLAPAWVVAGPPGSGKSVVGGLFLQRLSPVPAILDKDVMYGGFVATMLTAAHRPFGEREGDWYDQHIKVHEYAGMSATATLIRAYGCPVMLSAPFTQQTHHADEWQSFVAELGGDPVTLIWVRSDQETLRQRLIQRGLEQDREKLSRFGEFFSRAKVHDPPIVEHIAIDNRASCEVPLEDQVDQALKILQQK